MKKEKLRNEIERKRNFFDTGPYATHMETHCETIGMWGGCGNECPAFLLGECENPEEILPGIETMTPEDLRDYLDEFDIESIDEIRGLYTTGEINVDRKA